MGANESEAKLPETEDQSTSLPIPGLHTWRGVYVFVMLTLAAYVVLLTFLGKAFSS